MEDINSFIYVDTGQSEIQDNVHADLAAKEVANMTARIERTMLDRYKISKRNCKA